MTQGLLYYAFDNAEIDYVKLATVSAKFATKHLDKPAALVTNRKIRRTKNSPWDHVIVVDNDDPQKRTFRNGIQYKKMLDWHNGNRYTAYDLTPYDQTILLDADYLVLTDQLNMCWDSEYSIMINSDSKFINGEPTLPTEKRISWSGPDMLWATVVYFQKCEESKTFFDTVSVVKQYYQYYRKIYNISSGVFRNDHAFSIANHIMSGYSSESFVKPLPVPWLLHAMDSDEIVKYNNNKISFLTSNGYARTVADQDIHIMNKYSLLEKIK